MIEARFYHTATLLPNGTVLLAGGYVSSGLPDPLASAELYDPSRGSWTATAGMIEARFYHTATLLRDGKVLVAGGRLGVSSAELYDPSTGSWTATGTALLGGRSGHTATLLPDGRVLVTGGENISGSDEGVPWPLASAELYDPGTMAWTATLSMADARSRHTATLLPDGKVLVAGGYVSSGDGLQELASAELYDPSTGSWTATGDMIEARWNHTATLLRDGKVLVAGSSGASAELYDPSTGSWTATGTVLLEGRFGHTATLLPDGTVLVAGGFGLDGALASAARYDPRSGSWTTTVGMIEARGAYTATLLLEGTVLVAGGSGGDDALASAELYDPSGGR